MTWALAAALAGTIGYGAASVLQAAGAARVHGPALLWHPAYLAGLALDGFAWLASLVAVRQLPLFAVQSILAGSIAVTVVLASLFLGTSLGVRHWIAIASVLTGLVGVAIASGSQSAQAPPQAFATFALVGLGVVLVLALLVYRRRAPASMAVLAGMAFSGAALCARSFDGSGDWRHLVSQPVVWAVLGFGLVGMVAYARSGSLRSEILCDRVGWLRRSAAPFWLLVLASCSRPDQPRTRSRRFRLRRQHDLPRSATPERGLLVDVSDDEKHTAQDGHHVCDHVTLEDLG